MPSYLAVNSTWTGDPSAFSPCDVYLMPPSLASMVRVWLFGAGPGLYLDLDRLAFQVPTLLSAAQATTVKANAATSRLEMKKSLLRIFCSSPKLGVFVVSLPEEERNVLGRLLLL